MSRLVLVALFGTAWLALSGGSAHADEVSGGRLDWGLKASFRDYLVGPIAQGGWEPTGGATATDDGRFRFRPAFGEFDPGSGEFRASYSGGVRFTGHEREDGSPELDLTIAEPTVEIVDGAGILYVDVTSEAGSDRQVPFATLEISGVDVGDSGTVVATGVAATLTAQGAEAFAGFYTEGEQLDPVDFTGDVTAAAEEDAEPEPEPSDTGSPAPSAPPSPEPAAPSASPRPVAQADDDDSGSVLLPVALGAAAMVVTGVIAGTVMLRRRGGPGADQAPDEATQD